MMPLSPGELALNRAPFVDALPDRATIARYSHLSDGAGGYTDVWLPDAHTVACRVAPNTTQPREQPVGGGVSLVQTYTVTFEAGTEIRGEDRVLWTEPLTERARLLQVVGPGGRSQPLSRRVLCVEVEAAA
jgi:hypothetical protein